ncbi:hypothetical protein F2Q69_00024549 [Brassica cretica]|uniref:SREBP regulating gene protein n=1 Tax=Brassica cretica TaxID=69181 RepID=A0A8S9Q740_BRACR|nr:hypothetical protein F2Q69_00024549 [Brassica cretica]
MYLLSSSLLSVSLLLCLAAVSAIASSGNMTSGFSYGGCVSGVTVGECITAAVEDEEGVEAVVRRILQQQRRKLSYKARQKQQSCNGKIAALEQFVTFDCCIVDCYVNLLDYKRDKEERLQSRAIDRSAFSGKSRLHAREGNATSELRYDGCAPRDTVRECNMVPGEKEEEKEVVRRILQPRSFISPKPLQRQQALPCKIAGNCIKPVNGKDETCTYYDCCQRSA